jgi:phosphoglycolate phosphatase
MIGDRKFDIIGAKENGLKSIGVTWGHGERTELQDAGADQIVDSIEELNFNAT